METFDGRLHSFDKPKSRSSSKSSSGRAWPHPKSFVANPKSLAEAGFFFKPSKDDPDNVRCFICKKELGGWDEDDNPFEIHINKCPKCPWAIARCSLEFDVDSHGNFSLKDPARLPSNKVLEKARADTFGGKKWWPHDAVKNHGATSKKMAKAGFVYTPQVEGDDTATCLYCDLSLSGWDAEDDPAKEHIKRVERSGKPCPFFEAAERPKSQASSKSTKTNSRQSRAPKRAAIASDDNEEETVAVKAPAKQSKQKLSEAATSSTTSTSLKKTANAPSIQEEAEESEELEEDDDPSLKVKPTPAPRKSSRKPASKSKPATKAKAKSKQRIHALAEEAQKSDGETDVKPEGSRSTSEKRTDLEKENDELPSNVDGRIAKPYEDFSVDVDAAEGTAPMPQSTTEIMDRPLILSHSPEPEVDLLPRPTTPEDQILRPELPKTNTNTTDFRISFHVPPSPADLFLPPLANSPLQTVVALTDMERAMTVEQWIRHEMAVQYEKLKEDGERRIRAFLEQAEETRKQIEAL